MNEAGLSHLYNPLQGRIREQGNRVPNCADHLFESVSNNAHFRILGLL